jgi:membrane protein YqaA with SNARE-associated domain
VITFVAFLWGLAEATLFFIVPDVFLTFIALRSLRRALIASIFAVVGAIVGGVLMYFFASRSVLLSIPAINGPMIDDVGQQVANHAAWSVFLGPLRGIPYKIYAAQWGWQHLSLATLVLITIPARAIRFVLTTALASFAASALRKRIQQRTIVAIHVIVWTAFYVMYFTKMTR